MRWRITSVLPSPVSGPELVMNMEKHVRRFGAEIVNQDVQELILDGAEKKIVCARETYTAKAVILCTGATPRTLGLPNEDALRGSGVSYCATCDGAFYRGKSVAVVGGGDTALEDALFLSNFCKEVYLIHRRDAYRAAKILVDKLEQNEKIKRVNDSVVTGINTNADQVVESVTVENVKTQESSTLPVSGLFVAVGTIAENRLFKDKVACDENGYVLTDESMRTSVEGVVRRRRHPQEAAAPDYHSGRRRRCCGERGNRLYYENKVRSILWYKS